MTSWCKLSGTYYADPAVLRAGEAAELLFVRGLSYCREHNTAGHIPAAALPYLVATDGEHRAAALVREGLWLTEGDGYQVRSWDKWQEEGDALAERRRRDRERKRAERASTRTVRGQSEDTSADVHGIKREEKRREETTPNGVVNERADKPRDTQRGTRIPEPFALDEHMRADAHAEGFDDQAIDRIAASFADYWRAQPGAKGRKTDWPATWRNWVRREADNRRGSNVRPLARASPTVYRNDPAAHAHFDL